MSIQHHKWTPPCQQLAVKNNAKERKGIENNVSIAPEKGLEKQSRRGRRGIRGSVTICLRKGWNKCTFKYTGSTRCMIFAILVWYKDYVYFCSCIINKLCCRNTFNLWDTFLGRPAAIVRGMHCNPQHEHCWHRHDRNLGRSRSTITITDLGFWNLYWATIGSRQRKPKPMSFSNMVASKQ